MSAQELADGVIFYLGLVTLLTFHEFGHAWMAWKCGDDTARLQGRVSLNPLVHIDPIGTVVIPLLMIFLSPSVGRFLVGWAKPVPVNPSNLRNRRVDDILVTLAGPWMNLMLAVALVALARVGLMAHSANMVDICLRMAQLSMLLFFFNLLPIPPLDGSQVARVLLNISYETYHQVARFGFLILIVVIQIPFIRQTLGEVTEKSLNIIAGWFGM
ncbi:MAG TPA: site-2 protease family protein [Verrucomicrobiae bacterium]|jgi:Zn-dependent protease